MTIVEEVRVEISSVVRTRLLEALRDGEVLLVTLQDFVLQLPVGPSKAVIRFEITPKVQQ